MRFDLAFQGHFGQGNWSAWVPTPTGWIRSKNGPELDALLKKKVHLEYLDSFYNSKTDKNELINVKADISLEECCFYKKIFIDNDIRSSEIFGRKGPEHRQGFAGSQGPE